MIIVETSQHINTKNAAKSLQERNDDWRRKHSPNFFKGLAEGQSPQVLVIACSDSRVSPSVISQSNLGELFEFRNIANVTLPTDINIKALLSFALLHLQIKHVVVCGHYQCGGINAAMDIVENNLELDDALASHLAPIVDVYKENKVLLGGIEDKTIRHQKLVELNVAKQVENLRSLDFIEKMTEEENVELPMFHGAVFDIEQGRLKLISQPTQQEAASHVKSCIASQLSRLSYFASSYNPFQFIGASHKRQAIQAALENIKTDEALLIAIKDPASELYQALNHKRLLPITFLSFSKGFTLDANSLHRVQEILPEENNICCAI